MTEPEDELGWTYGRPARATRSLLQHLIVCPILRMITPVVVRDGSAFVGLSNPVIVASNHVSHLDTPVVLRALPRRIRSRLVVAAAKDYFYRSRLRGTLVSLSMATIPFDRGAGSKDSLGLCESLIRDGWSLLIFPEGTPSPKGPLGRGRPGVAVLAVATQVPVLPVFVHGLADVMPKGRVAPLPGGVMVDVGDVLRPEQGEDVSTFRNRVEASLLRLSERRPEWGTEPPHIPSQDPDGSG